MADMHYINPLKSLMLAIALDVIPAQVIFLGCETAEHEEIGFGLSPAVDKAIPVAFAKVVAWIESVTKNYKVKQMQE